MYFVCILKQVILDTDSFVNPTIGIRKALLTTGIFECTCYYLLFCFRQYGDAERALLRHGNVNNADERICD